MTKKQVKTQEKDKPIKIHQCDLPLSCPRPGVPLWNLHPQVYLPIEETKEEVCPYCSAHYCLVDA